MEKKNDENDHTDETVVLPHVRLTWSSHLYTGPHRPITPSLLLLILNFHIDCLCVFLCFFFHSPPLLSPPVLCSLVLRAIKDLDPSRRCYRSIGGVLVERTVAEVVPAVQKNLSGIEELITKLTNEMKEKEAQADEYRIKHNITMGEVEQENNDEEDADKDKKQTDDGKGKRTQKEGGGGVLA